MPPARCIRWPRPDEHAQLHGTACEADALVWPPQVGQQLGAVVVVKHSSRMERLLREKYVGVRRRGSTREGTTMLELLSTIVT